MARKITVHNLAKEVGKPYRELIDYLTGKGYESVTAVSAVPDGEVANIRARFGPEIAKEQPEAPAADEAAKAPSKEERKERADEADKPKKKGIARVYRSQNATQKLQKRPRRPLPPAGQDRKMKSLVPDAEEAKIPAAIKTEPVPAASPEPKTEEVKASASPAETAQAAAVPVKEELPAAAPVSEAAAETAVPKEAPQKAEEPAAAKAEPAAEEKPVSAPKKESAPKAEESAAAEAPAQEMKKETAPVKESAPKKAETKKAEAKKPEAKKTDDRKPEERKTEEKKPEDTGFRNGRIIRSFGNALRAQAAAAAQKGGRGERGDRQGGRGGQMRDRTAGGGRPAGDRRGPSGDRQRGGAGRGERPASGPRTGAGTAGGGRPGVGGTGMRSGPFAGRPRPQAAPAAGGDGALAHKTSRDFRKDGKERERNREERRENGRGRGTDNTRGGNGKRTFNRIPKALQQRNNAPQEKKQEEAVTEIRIPERITVRELAERMKIPGAQIVKELFMKGDMVTLNHELPYEKAEEIAMEHDIICEMEEKEDVIGALLAEEEEDESTMVGRPPVVCVMGHVDHGKTSLLDAIRNTHVTDREAGGITQHIGAYMVTVHGQKITFLDTPGHEAFTAMRMRGANATDIAVLVVAADDGVMPQTVEAINHAKAAGVEIIVAVNKIDKPGANIDRVKQELSEYELVAEDWGGSTVFCPVSAKTQEGLENLLEMILLTSEMHELKANPKRKARGIVLEAKLDKGRGPVASILIQKGTLHQGDFIACGAAHGKVRAMTDENGRRLSKATPSMPVEIIGLSSVPEAGEVLVSLDSDREAKDFAAVFVSENKKTLIEDTKTQISLDDLFNQIKEGNLKELPIVVKADVQGSVEAVSQSLLKLTNDEVVVKVIHGGVGAINESDVSLAAASNAIIIGFNVKPDATAKSIADTQKVEIKLYNVIYEAIEDVERALKGMRAAVYEEKIQGHAEIRQIFRASSIGNIAGAYIKDGIFTRSSKVRVFRKDEKIYEGSLASLKRFKDDVKEVREGYECGFVFDGFGDFEVEDTVEAYIMVEVPRE